MSFLEITRGDAPLILSIPHAGTEIPETYKPGLVSLWRARKDADWWLPELYAFAESHGATIIRTRISRTIIDVNRDPSGASLYPGQATTGLCPTETFDGEPLYHPGAAPDEAEIAHRRKTYFAPYHAAIAEEISRLKQQHATIVLYDCHSIRSKIPRLFPGILPNFNIGTNDGKSCAPAITQKLVEICGTKEKTSHVVNGRFKGGWITRNFGNPAQGINAIQMELACRGYMDEPEAPDAANWPSPLHKTPEILPVLQTIIESFLP
jgi:formiminoglutamase